MADTRGDNLSPVIQELLKNQQMQRSKNLKSKSNEQAQSQSLDNENTIVMIGKKGKDGKPEFSAIVETDKNGKVTVQEVTKNGKLNDITNQYKDLSQQKNQEIQEVERSNRISDDIVPGAKVGQELDNLNKKIYAKENVKSDGDLDRRVEERVDANTNYEKAVNDTLDQEKKKLSFDDFNEKLSEKGLEASLEKTGEYTNAYPKVKVQIYNQDLPNQQKDWNQFSTETVDKIKNKVNLNSEYQRKFNLEVVTAQRQDLKKKLEESEITSNRIVMTRDGEKVNFSFQDSDGNKEVLDKLNNIPDNNKAIQIAEQYNEKIKDTARGFDTNSRAYDNKIAEAIPLQKENIKEQSLKMS